VFKKKHCKKGRCTRLCTFEIRTVCCWRFKYSGMLPHIDWSIKYEYVPPFRISLVPNNPEFLDFDSLLSSYRSWRYKIWGCRTTSMGSLETIILPTSLFRQLVVFICWVLWLYIAQGNSKLEARQIYTHTTCRTQEQCGTSGDTSRTRIVSLKIDWNLTVLRANAEHRTTGRYLHHQSHLSV
jgi:hypothetical protein